MFRSLLSIALLSCSILAAQDPAIDQFTITPRSLNFQGAVNGELPASQSIVIFAGRAPANLEVFADTGYDGAPAPDWLTVTPRNITTPSRILVSVRPNNLPAGPNLARIRIRTRGTIALLDIATLPVTLTLADRPASLDPTPGHIRFTLRSSARADQFLILRNTGSGRLDCNTITATPADPWLAVSTQPGAPCRLRISAAAAGLRLGSYSSSLVVRSPIGNASVPVSLLVSAPGPALALNPAGFQFEARQDNGNAISRNLSVLNTGDSNVNFSAEILDPSQVPWLTLGSRSGSVPPGASATIPVTVTPSGLAPGLFYALIQVSAPESRNSPQLFQVSFLVTPPGSPAVGTPTPSGLLFVADAGVAAPVQPISIFTSSATAVPYQVSNQTVSGGGWLTIERGPGVTSTGAPARLNAAASAASLSPGVYTGEITTIVIAQGSAEMRSVNVTFIVRPAAPRTIRTTSHCTPARIAATHTGLVSNFVTRTGWPTPLNVRLANDCGDLVTNGQVLLSFSNGDTPLALTSLNNGNYAGTWTPINPAASSMSVKADVFAEALSTSVELIGSVAQIQTPVLFPNGILNNLHPNLGAPISPGMIVQIFGSGLGGAAVQPPLIQGSLPTQFGDVSVIVGGMRAPLYFLSPGQINAQIPFELKAGEQHQVIVRAGRAISTPESVNVASSQPGLLGFPDGRLIAQDTQFRLIDSANPASRGAVLVIYLTGLGGTNPPVPTGLLTPAIQASATDPVTVEIDGRPAPVFFAGLTPGFIGLYQVNFEVPPDARLADLPVRVLQNGVPSNQFLLPVR
ncbi:MAG: hypothetical protein JJE04_15975 [Acidobacteriia bacterium]|nr:hypothetical protein [Terriglobia bacterium]